MGERKFRTDHRVYNPYVPNEIWNLFKKDLRKIIKHVFPEQSFAITEYYWRNSSVNDEYIRFQSKDGRSIDWPRICNVMAFLSRIFGMKVLTLPSEDPTKYNYGRFTLGNIRTWTIAQLDTFLANHSYEAIEEKYDSLLPEVIRSEQEKWLHQCCFTGSIPEDLNAPEKDVKQWLEILIDKAIDDGYDTFISGCTKGVEIWAGQIIVEKRLQNPELHLIAALPHDYRFAKDWDLDWRRSYREIVRCADVVKSLGDYHQGDSIRARNTWMVDNSSRMIVYCTDKDNEVKNTIDYAKEKKVSVFLCGLDERK